MSCRIVKRAVSLLVGNKNFSKIRWYNELGIIPTEVSSGLPRIQAYTKWSISKVLIGEFVINPGRRVWNWVKINKLWMKRYIPDAREPLKEAKKIMMERIKKKLSKTKAGVFEDLYLPNIKSSLKDELILRRISLTGYKNFLKIRGDDFYYAYRLVAQKKLNERYKTVCLICDKDEREDIFPLLFKCERYSKERKKMLKKIALFNLKSLPEMIKVLLGGERIGSGPTHRIGMEALVEYLRAIISKRTHALENLAP